MSAAELRTTETSTTGTRRIRTLAAVGAVVGITAAVVACSPDAPRSVPPSVTFATAPPSTTGVPPEAEGTPDSGMAAGTTTPGRPEVSTGPDQTIPVPVDPTVDLVMIGTFDTPLDLAGRTGDATLFVVERVGRILPVRDGVVGAPVLDITALTTIDNERGLLGLTFSDDGASAYVHHTDRDGANVIAEYAVGPDGVFDAPSRRVLLTVDQPYPNHNGGGIAIGPDGMLYISIGDGGAANDPLRSSLDVSSPLGKILRIDPRPDGSRPYRIPPDNPFIGVERAVPEVWAVGLRNPWRFSFDSATGDLWIADVGQRTWEEVNLARRADGGGRGWNFGWSAFEGSERFHEDQPPEGATPPVYEYPHENGDCAISGGAVGRDPSVAELDGWYVFGDYCSGVVTALDVSAAGTVRAVVPLATAESVVAVRAGPDGALYVLSLAGSIWRITDR